MNNPGFTIQNGDQSTLPTLFTQLTQPEQSPKLPTLPEKYHPRITSLIAKSAYNWGSKQTKIELVEPIPLYPKSSYV